MEKSKSDSGVDTAEEYIPGTIPHMILLPERFGTGRCTGDGTGKYQDAVRDAAVRIARRFARPYVVTVSLGLVRLEFFDTPSEERMQDLSQDRRNRLLNLIGEQIRADLKPDMRIITFVTGPELRSLQRLRVPLVVPMAGMAVSYRRRWLVALAEASDVVLGMAMFGGGYGGDWYPQAGQRRPMPAVV